MHYAARVNDAHTCPMSAPIPHGGGVIVGPGVATVQIGHLPAAVSGTTCTCAMILPNSVSGGSSTVKIGFLPAARAGDSTAHGGVIVGGCTTVTIGG
jgi:uncharacterized Zn-binding protein involved in type VI secretion